jgi:hypothetical protein
VDAGSVCPKPGSNPIIREFPAACQPARQTTKPSSAQNSSFPFTIHTDLKANSGRPSILTIRDPDLGVLELDDLLLPAVHHSGQYQEEELPRV